MINGGLLRDAVISAAHSISNKKKSVDELNVFPVPDGDTGTNMSMTITNSVAELENLSDDTDCSVVASTTASALLRGARGNSGVILSLIFRGFAKGLAGKKEMGANELGARRFRSIQERNEAYRGNYPDSCKRVCGESKRNAPLHKRSYYYNGGSLQTG